MIHIVDYILTYRIVTSHVVVRSVLLTSDEIVWVVAVPSVVTDLVDHLGGRIDE